MRCLRNLGLTVIQISVKCLFICHISGMTWHFTYTLVHYHNLGALCLWLLFLLLTWINSTTDSLFSILFFFFGRCYTEICNWTCLFTGNASRLPQLVPDQILKLKQLTVLTLAETNKVSFLGSEPHYSVVWWSRNFHLGLNGTSSLE